MRFVFALELLFEITTFAALCLTGLRHRKACQFFYEHINVKSARLQSVV